MDAGTKHTCAIDVDGQVTCWGSNGDNAGTTYGQSDPPSAP